MPDGAVVMAMELGLVEAEVQEALHLLLKPVGQDVLMIGLDLQ
jgi:hypothetical protein